MIRKTMMILLAAIMVLGLGKLSFASVARRVDVVATIPSMHSLSVDISKVDTPGDAWHSGQSSIDFGTLYFDTAWHVFRARCYYAVDVGVASTQADWSVVHNKEWVAHTTMRQYNLDSNINVSFMKQLDSTHDQQIEKVAYLNSYGKVFTKAQLSGGWLRIYYGIATGNTDPANGFVDAPGTSPITIDKPAGTYRGYVTLTLIP